LIKVFMIDNKKVKELKKILGKGKVFVEDEYLLTYSYDATQIRRRPDIVVIVENESDVKKTLEFAYKNNIPVVPRGAGVGYSGGAIPVKGGIELVFTRMNKILKIDKINRIAIVQPGVITYNLQKEVEKAGLYYPPDPASLKTSTIGGNVMENAGGPRCFKYGVTLNYVMSVEGYLINGKKVSFGNMTIKDVAGYDLKSLVVGSEGTLVVLTEIMLKLIPKPETKVLVKIDLKTLKNGAVLINELINRNIQPSAIEFIDSTSLLAVSKYLNLDYNKEIGSSVIIELDGSKGAVDLRLTRLKEISERFELIEFNVAVDDKEQEELWKMRRNISPAVSKLKPKKINEDIVVPVSEIPETVEYFKRLSEEFGVMIVIFGHLGDGNIHTNIMINPENKEEVEKSEILLDKIFKYVVSKRGSITGEHGIGITKKRFLSYQFSDVEIELFKKIKTVFDEKNLLNPDKIF